MAMRVLLLGPTGVDKKYVQEVMVSEGKKGTLPCNDLKVIDFEHDYICQFAEDILRYLDGKEEDQVRLWNSAWGELVKDFSKSSDIMISMHAVLARPFFTNRSPVLIEPLKKIGFTHIITLIDDVYDMWYRTESRAENAAVPLRPTLIDLIETRRAESIVGDIIANQLSSEKNRLINFFTGNKTPCKNYYFSFKRRKINKKKNLCFSCNKKTSRIGSHG
ncbi:MAG: hypothetical protein ABIE07_09520 [Candidatus Zixiibacteriota bacterium]